MIISTTETNRQRAGRTRRLATSGLGGNNAGCTVRQGQAPHTSASKCASYHGSYHSEQGRKVDGPAVTILTKLSPEPAKLVNTTSEK